MSLFSLFKFNSTHSRCTTNLAHVSHMCGNRMHFHAQEEFNDPDRSRAARFVCLFKETITREGWERVPDRAGWNGRVLNNSNDHHRPPSGPHTSLPDRFSDSPVS